MSLVRIDRNPGRRQLLVFKVLWLLFFGALALEAYRRDESNLAAVALGAIAVFVPAIGSLAPRFMRLVYVGMAYLTFPIGFVLSHVLLAAIYFLVLTPTGIVMRLCGIDPMGRKFDARAATYWTARPTASPERERYFRQF